MSYPVLHIIDHLGLGGAQRRVKEIMDLDPHPKLYLAVLRESSYQQLVQSKSVLIHHSSSKYALSSLFALVRLIKEKEIRLLHCHLFRAQVYAYFIKKFIMPSLILVHHERGIIYGSDSKWGLDIASYKMFMKFSKPVVSRYTALTEAVKQELITQFEIDPAKITVLRNFVDLNTFSPEKREHKRKIKRAEMLVPMKPEKFIVGFAGRLTPDKGVRFVLAAALEMIQDSDIHFIIAGDGPLQQELLEVLNRPDHQAANITYVGFCEDMTDFYSTIDLFVMPSLREASGSCQYEAMAMGVPVLVSNIPAMMESVPFSPKICSFKVGDVSEMIGKIRFLKDNHEEYGKIADMGKDFTAGFTHANYFSKLHKLEEELIPS